MHVAILTGGGDCPGLNAVIRAVTLALLQQGDRVTGIERGFLGLIERRARQVAPATLDRELGEGYGIYRGKATAMAVLRFSADAARWVRAEVWHPQQSITELDDEGLELRIPYGAAQELEMDILRHGEQVEVLEPPALRERIAGRLAAAARAYANRRG